MNFRQPYVIDKAGSTYGSRVKATACLLQRICSASSGLKGNERVYLWQGFRFGNPETRVVGGFLALPLIPHLTLRKSTSLPQFPLPICKNKIKSAKSSILQELADLGKYQDPQKTPNKIPKQLFLWPLFSAGAKACTSETTFFSSFVARSHAAEASGK